MSLDSNDNVDTVTMESAAGAPDFTVVINSKNPMHIKCHKSHLMSHSKYFSVLINESQVDDVTLPERFNKHARVIETFVKMLYIYPAVLLTAANIMCVAWFADYFDCQYVLSACDEYFVKQAGAAPPFTDISPFEALRYASKYKRAVVDQHVVDVLLRPGMLVIQYKKWGKTTQLSACDEELSVATIAKLLRLHLAQT